MTNYPGAINTHESPVPGKPHLYRRGGEWFLRLRDIDYNTIGDAICRGWEHVDKLDTIEGVTRESESC